MKRVVVENKTYNVRIVRKEISVDVVKNWEFYCYMSLFNHSVRANGASLHIHGWFT